MRAKSRNPSRAAVRSDHVFAPRGRPRWHAAVQHGLWEALERLVDEGRCKAIGLSDVNLDQSRAIVDAARIKPAVIHVESHPYLPEWGTAQLLQGKRHTPPVQVAVASITAGSVELGHVFAIETLSHSLEVSKEISTLQSNVPLQT